MTPGRRRPASSLTPLPFQEVFLPTLAEARARLRSRAGQRHRLLAPRAHAALERDLVYALSGASAPALFERFTRFRARTGARPDGSRAGRGPGGTYRRFVQRAGEDRLAEVLRHYPALAELLLTLTDDWVNATAELLQRLDADRDSLARHLEVHGQVTSARGLLSDRHAHGRSAICLRFASGRRVMYKPRPLGLEAAFETLVAWINQQGGPLDLRAPAVLDRGAYGWMEFIPHGPIPTKAGIRRYYERAGMLLCLASVLGATDLHYGNVIAAGEYPVLVDLETLLQPPEADSPRTVLGTGLLPHWVRGAGGGSYDVSGFGAISRQTAPFGESRWRHRNTDAMALERAVSPVAARENVARYRGRALSPAGYITDMVRGFRTAYHRLRRQRGRLLAADGPLARFADQPVRLILRHTVTYHRIIERSLRPDALRSTEARQAVLASGLAQPLAGRFRGQDPARFAGEEASQLARLDIPLFQVAGDGSDWATAHRGGFRTAAGASGYGAVRARLLALNDEELEREVQLIGAAVGVWALGASDRVRVARRSRTRGGRPAPGGKP